MHKVDFPVLLSMIAKQNNKLSVNTDLQSNSTRAGSENLWNANQLHTFIAWQYILELLQYISSTHLTPYIEIILLMTRFPMLHFMLNF